MVDTSFLVAVLGVGGTLAGGALTAVINSRAQPRAEEVWEREQILKVRAQESAHAHAVHSEHHSWLRARRESAYLAFLEAAEAARVDVLDLAIAIRERAIPAEELETLRIAARERMRTLLRTRDVLEIAGPEAVAEPARTHYANLVDYWRKPTRMLERRAESEPAEAEYGLLRAALLEDREQLEDSQRAVVAAARSALEQLPAAVGPTSRGEEAATQP
ncbi:hypothetical protein GCM10010193_15510 [Kitasatospora atroaurantiaca]|uniref:Uncharacterized protein n=1 Tax=Kitasatospora atroaurantiaca TaxID=285545 RepID=A0A561EIJ7_9ACTN|nr:hypothetical protein [Kitasatospora atroaurantiaca]TWE15438.1 hypothetical protein FB465_0332 [Kitasatospora atroaurantiaca]